MGNNISGRFADQDSYVVTGQIQTANNNQITLNAALDEADFLRGTNVALQPTGLLATTGNPVPSVAQTLQGTIGAALGNVGQENTASQEPGGGGIPCFLGNVLFSLWNAPQIPFARLFEEQERWKKVGSLSFDDVGNRVQGEILSVFQNVKYEYLHVTFEDYTADDVVAEHRYFTPDGYVCIKDLLNQVVYTEYERLLKVVSIHEVQVPQGIWVYNAHIKNYQNYCANRRKVHNLKPLTE